jgi:transposase
MADALSSAGVLEVGIVGVVGFEQRIHDLVEGVPELADIMEPLLAARRVLREKFAKLHRKVLLLARDNEVCQRLMTIPGVGPVVSLGLYQHGRRSSALQELEGCWAIPRADAGSQSVRREPSRWANLVMWRRGHESAAL